MHSKLSIHQRTIFQDIKMSWLFGFLVLSILSVSNPMVIHGQENGQAIEEDQDDSTDMMEDEELYQLFEDRVLILKISAKVLNEDHNIIWTMNLQELTIVGRGVFVRLNGGNLRLNAEFKPFIQDTGELMLSADSETWLTIGSSNAEGALTPVYQNMINTLPIQIGKPIVFYPLGMGQESNGPRAFNLEIEIVVEPYLESIRTEEGMAGS